VIDENLETLNVLERGVVVKSLAEEVKDASLSF
jgi:hypothetical protein